MEKEKKYAKCAGCGGDFPRDDLKSANIHVYEGVCEVQEKIPLRLCPKCFEHELGRWKLLKWTGVLFTK